MHVCSSMSSTSRPYTPLAVVTDLKPLCIIGLAEATGNIIVIIYAKLFAYTVTVLSVVL